MKLFAYALREYDELKFMRQYSKEYGFDFDYTTAYPTLENAGLAKGYEAVTIITNPLDRPLLDRFYSLGVRYISTRSIGYEHIDTEYANAIGIRISNVSYSPNSVANYTIMLMLMACRNLPYILDKARLQDFSLNGKIGRELSRSTVGVVGTGRIGETVISHLQGFGCRILAYDVFQKESVAAMASYTDLDTLFRESDIITLHVPGMEANHHMIGRKAFGKMKDGIILINAARGLLIDTGALIEGLQSGKVGFAALDTIENEAGLYYLNLEERILDNHDRAILQSFPNVILSPHMAFYTQEAVSDMVRNAVLGLIHFMKGEENPFEVHGN